MVCPLLSSGIFKQNTTSLPGVASHEGRVLVMTTNRPESLDDALIRPGRVDHQVAFSNATQYQIKELFERMYANELPRTRLQPSVPPTNLSTAQPAKDTTPLPSNTGKDFTPPATPIPTAEEHSLPEKTNEKSNRPSIGKVLNSVVEEVQGEELSTLAKKFAEQIPDGMFSPAEIQGFLLKRKKDPRKAHEEVGKWVKGMVEVKRVGGKLVPQ